MKRLLLIICAAGAFTGCVEQRDLYGVSSPLLYIEGDWEPSLDRTDMSQDATAVVYDGSGLVDKEYFYNPDNTTAPLTAGTYDIMIFNGLMYSEDDTHIDGVLFRGTGRIETFEAYAKEATANKRLVMREGEYIATNDMEVLTSMSQSKTVEGENGYYVKYKDGKNGYPVVPDYIEDELFMTPRPVSYECSVVVTLTNPGGAATANGALRGFAGSVFMQSRMPSHTEVVHQFRLNSLTYIDPDPVTGEPRGTLHLQEPLVTFGPPLDLPGRRYELELSILLKDNTTENRTFDITDQVEPIVAQLTAQLDDESPIISITIPIEIVDPIVLPVITPDTGIVIDDWSDDEEITVPIRSNKP